MHEKKKPKKPKREKAKPSLAQPLAKSLVSMAVRNLVDMLAVVSVSGTVLLSLLAAHRF